MATTTILFNDIEFHEEIKNPREGLHDIDELIASIKSVGLQMPLTVLHRENKDAINGDKKDFYYLVVGFRRYEAVRQIREQDENAFKTIEVKRFKGSTAEAQVLNLTENVQRSDLSPIEIANGVEILLNLGYKQKEIAEKIGKSQSWVSNVMQFRKSATPQLKTAVSEGQISYGFARTIATLADREQREQVATIRCSLLAGIDEANNGSSKGKNGNGKAVVEPKKVETKVRKEVREASGRIIRPSTVEVRDEVNRLHRDKAKLDEFDMGILSALTWTLGESKTLKRPS